MTHRDRAGDPSGQPAGRREAAGDPGSWPKALGNRLYGSLSRTFGIIVAGAIAAGLTACANRPEAPEIVSSSDSQVSILADLHASPRPLAEAYCAQYLKRAVMRDTQSAPGNLIRGWATGTKVFRYTFDCM